MGSGAAKAAPTLGDARARRQPMGVRVGRSFLPFGARSSTSLGNNAEEQKMFISPAFAQSFGGIPQDQLTSFVLPMALIFVVFYFFMIKPQQTKAKQTKAMLDALRRGDRVVTAGGILGTVAKVEGDQEVTVEI